jgi:hypothetical protein
LPGMEIATGRRWFPRKRSRNANEGREIRLTRQEIAVRLALAATSGHPAAIGCRRLRDFLPACTNGV